jgi:hypothetical protein
MRSFRRRWTYPPFVPPPLCIFNQEENTVDSEEIGVKKEKKKKEVMRQVKKKVKSTILYPK